MPSVHEGVCGVTGTFIHCWWDCKVIKTLWKKVWQSKSFTYYVSAFLPLDIYSRKKRKYIHTQTICSNLQWKQQKCQSVSEWIFLTFKNDGISVE